MATAGVIVPFTSKRVSSTAAPDPPWVYVHEGISHLRICWTPRLTAKTTHRSGRFVSSMSSLLGIAWARCKPYYAVLRMSWNRPEFVDAGDRRGDLPAKKLAARSVGWLARSFRRRVPAASRKGVQGRGAHPSGLRGPIAQQLLHVERRRVEEQLARLPQQERLRVHARLFSCGQFRQHRGLGGLQHAVQPSQHGERQDDLAVLGLLVVAAQQICDGPDERGEIGIGHACVALGNVGDFGRIAERILRVGRADAGTSTARATGGKGRSKTARFALSRYSRFMAARILFGKHARSLRLRIYTNQCVP